MSTEAKRVGYPPVSLDPGPHALFRIVSRLVSRTKIFIQAFVAAGAVAKQAERYYEMSNAELARIGLTREQIPAALLRALERDRR
ncbi:MAG TPA: hypothetical protein VNL39_05940 [Xanthobacteraceae bacterium]|nr:hypothetical protein [Xanthobacteraceae bacterium]